MSSYQPSTPPPSQPSQPRQTPSTPPSTSTPATRSVGTQSTSRAVSTQSQGSASEIIARQQYVGSSTVTSSVSSTFNPTQETVDGQNRQFSADIGLDLEIETLSFFKYVEGRGAKFSIFPEEIAYDKNFTTAQGGRGSYPQSQTARYHFVYMITSGYVAHGAATPLTNLQIRAAHPELTDEKISAMRSVFNTNSTQRPFVFPVQISGYAPNTSELEKLKTLQRELYSYVNSKTPLEFKKTETFEGAPFNRKYHVTKEKSTISSVSASPPSNPNSGDLWFDSSSGRLFAYVKINNSIQWLEV